ncbi:Solitary outer membrane autotransporter beta-barrel domain [Vibrio alginolyticus]|nr:Solitary outer membrane autotransporter beta-barrel domain [Vibrio alginolyticus]
MKINHLVNSILVTLSLASISIEARTLREELKKEYERNFAVSVVLSDSDVFTVGFSDFDPNDSFNLNNEDIGSSDSVNLRKQVSLITLPFDFNIFEDEEKSTNQYQLKGRVYALGVEQDVTVLTDKVPDKSSDQMLGGYVEFFSEERLSDKLIIGGAFGYHLMYYKNDYDYRSDALDLYRPFLEGVYFNTDAWAAIGEINATLKYQENQSWGTWYLWSAPHYFYGTAWGDANNGDVGNPEGWYWVNGVKVFYDFSHIGTTIQTVYSSFNRVDIGGDTSKPMNAPHYYELSLGWLMTPPFKSSWIENVGLGLTINYGSALKGGSIVLFFNQE